MSTIIKKNFNLLIILAFPFLSGCGGGGLALALGSLFGPVGAGAGLAAGGGLALAGGAGGAVGGGGAIAAVHNPEPASMLLLAGGITAMACFKKFRNKI